MFVTEAKTLMVANFKVMRGDSGECATMVGMGVSGPTERETKNKRFAFGLCTDGISCSYYYQTRFVWQPRAVHSRGSGENGTFRTSITYIV